MEYDVVRANERFKGWGLFGDNAALAFFVGSVARLLDPAKPGEEPLRSILVVGGVVLGIAFLVGAWHIRGLIQPED